MPLEQRPEVVLKLHAKFQPKTVFFLMTQERSGQVDVVDIELAFGGEDVCAPVVERQLRKHERPPVERQPPPVEIFVEVAHGVVEDQPLAAVVPAWSSKL